jgi:hypothetical protein
MTLNIVTYEVGTPGPVKVQELHQDSFVIPYQKAFLSTEIVLKIPYFNSALVQGQEQAGNRDMLCARSDLT